MNKVLMVGRLATEPVVKPVGDKVKAFALLAVNRPLSKEQAEKVRARGGQTADFIPIEGWNATAAFMEKYLHKGVAVEIVGALRSSTYVDANGKRQNNLVLGVEHIAFAPTNASHSGTQAQTQTAVPAQAPVATQAPVYATPTYVPAAPSAPTATPQAYAPAPTAPAAAQAPVASPTPQAPAPTYVAPAPVAAPTAAPAAPGFEPPF